MSFRQHRDAWLLGAAALLLALGFAHPAIPWQRPLVDQVIVLDITQSMNTRDEAIDGVAVSRLAFAKHRLRQALPALRCGSKIGWAVFTEYRSYLLFAPVEVCAHFDELRATLDAIDNRMAWVGSSEVAKGLYGGLAIVKQLPDVPALMFVTDGHESPPINARYRPAFEHTPGSVRGLIVGVGGATPSPMPKTDFEGRPLGEWAADEVQQTDPRSQGRGGSVGGEGFVDDAAPPPPPALGATPGSEHLSALREPYLRLLAGEIGLSFHRLDSSQAFVAAMTAAGLARMTTVPADGRDALAGLALVLLLWRCAAQRRRAGSVQ
jgi:mxaL protein